MYVVGFVGAAVGLLSVAQQLLHNGEPSGTGNSTDSSRVRLQLLELVAVFLLFKLLSLSFGCISSHQIMATPLVVAVINKNKTINLPYGITQSYLPPDTSEPALPNPSHAGWYSIYLPQRDGRLS